MSKSTRHVPDDASTSADALVMTQEQILEVQDAAIRTRDSALLDAAWTALGYSRRYAFTPVTTREQRIAEAICLAALHRLGEA